MPLRLPAIRKPRAPKKLKFKLYGGPFDKAHIFLSSDCKSTIVFTAKGMTGRYARTDYGFGDFV